MIENFNIKRLFSLSFYLVLLFATSYWMIFRMHYILRKLWQLLILFQILLLFLLVLMTVIIQHMGNHSMSQSVQIVATIYIKKNYVVAIFIVICCYHEHHYQIKTLLRTEVSNTIKEFGSGWSEGYTQTNKHIDGQTIAGQEDNFHFSILKRAHSPVIHTTEYYTRVLLSPCSPIWWGLGLSLQLGMTVTWYCLQDKQRLIFVWSVVVCVKGSKRPKCQSVMCPYVQVHQASKCLSFSVSKCPKWPKKQLLNKNKHPFFLQTWPHMVSHIRETKNISTNADSSIDTKKILLARRGNFTPHMSISCQMWDHFFLLLLLFVAAAIFYPLWAKVFKYETTSFHYFSPMIPKILKVWISDFTKWGQKDR